MTAFRLLSFIVTRTLVAPVGAVAFAFIWIQPAVAVVRLKIVSVRMLPPAPRHLS